MILLDLCDGLNRARENRPFPDSVPKGRLKVAQDVVLGEYLVRTGDILDILDRALG